MEGDNNINTNTLKGFISKLDFISKKLEYQNNDNFEINYFNINENTYQINGTITINTETITFNTQLSQSEDMLIFKSTYKYSNNTQISYVNKTEIDIFTIVEQEQNSFFSSKTKYLIHLVDGIIKQAYVVNKKYKFENGISENYTKINMNNKEIFNSITMHYDTKNNYRAKK